MNVFFDLDGTLLRTALQGGNRGEIGDAWGIDWLIWVSLVPFFLAATAGGGSSPVFSRNIAPTSVVTGIWED